MKKLFALVFLTLAFAATVSASISPADAGPKQCGNKKTC
jgi:hypothetical protein